MTSNEFKPIRCKFDEIPKKAQVVDEFLAMLEELFLIRNPRSRFEGKNNKLFSDFIKKFAGKKSLSHSGEWFYYPWLGVVVHVLSDALFQEVRMARNKNLINSEEQVKYYNSKISVMGMSVGSHVVANLVMTGGAKALKLADSDSVGLSNLNRLRVGVTSLGVNKAVLAARLVYEINPYANVSVYDEGITDENLEEFIDGSDVLVEEIDNLGFKIKSRLYAKKKKIPVIMGTDNGDGVVVDVERYDKNPRLKIFHGYLEDVNLENIYSLSEIERIKLAARIAGAELNTTRMLESVLSVGKELYSWPQLGTAASLCGSIVAQIARRIILQEKIESGRYDVDLTAMFLKASSKDLRKKRMLLKTLGLKK